MDKKELREKLIKLTSTFLLLFSCHKHWSISKSIEKEFETKLIKQFKLTNDLNKTIEIVIDSLDLNYYFSMINKCLQLNENDESYDEMFYEIVHILFDKYMMDLEFNEYQNFKWKDTNNFISTFCEIIFP